MKLCAKCAVVKPIFEFARNKHKKDGRQTYCRACTRALDHARYEREVGHEVTPHAPRQSEVGRRAWLISLKTERPCTDCGKAFPYQVMQWDHKPGYEKFGDVSVDFWRHTRDEVLAEIAKCDLVCTNCHTVRTFARAGWALRWLKDAFIEYAA